MRTTLWALPVVLSIGLGTGSLAQQRSVTTVGSVMQLMDAMTIPASNAVFNVGRQPPETDEEWSALALSAVVLAESGNLLLIRDRARDEAAWTEASQAMVEAGAAALGAVEARDVDALLDAGDVVFGSCEACHATYLKRE